MIPVPLRRILPLAFFFAVAAHASTMKISPNSTVRAASEVEGDYTTTHLFVDEVVGDSIPVAASAG